MKQNYDKCLPRLLKDEGGYTNDPSDSGGATNYGITIADYKKYINKNGTSTDVKNMSVDQAKAIYRSKYWDALGCDDLPSGVDYSCFDYGVNSGLGRPRNALKKAKGKTGLALIDAINDERQSFLTNLANARPKDQRFIAGWTARVSRVRAYSKVLANDKTVPTGSATVAAGAVGGGFVALYWHAFLNHWVLYTLAIAAVGLTIDVAIELYRKNKNAVS